MFFFQALQPPRRCADELRAAEVAVNGYRGVRVHQEIAALGTDGLHLNAVPTDWLDIVRGAILQSDDQSLPEAQGRPIRVVWSMDRMRGEHG